MVEIGGVTPNQEAMVLWESDEGLERGERRAEDVLFERCTLVWIEFGSDSYSIWL